MATRIMTIDPNIPTVSTVMAIISSSSDIPLSPSLARCRALPDRRFGDSDILFPQFRCIQLPTLSQVQICTRPLGLMTIEAQLTFPVRVGFYRNNPKPSQGVSVQEFKDATQRS